MFNIGAAISGALQFAMLWHKVEFTNFDMPEVFASGLCTASQRPIETPDVRMGWGVLFTVVIPKMKSSTSPPPAASAIAPNELRTLHRMPGAAEPNWV